MRTAVGCAAHHAEAGAVGWLGAAQRRGLRRPRGGSHDVVAAKAHVRVRIARGRGRTAKGATAPHASGAPGLATRRRHWGRRLLSGSALRRRGQGGKGGRGGPRAAGPPPGAAPPSSTGCARSSRLRHASSKRDMTRADSRSRSTPARPRGPARSQGWPKRRAPTAATLRGLTKFQTAGCCFLATRSACRAWQHAPEIRRAPSNTVECVGLIQRMGRGSSWTHRASRRCAQGPRPGSRSGSSCVASRACAHMLVVMLVARARARARAWIRARARDRDRATRRACRAPARP